MAANTKIRIAGFLKTSVADGPGVRSVLFFQGCSKNCPGCHNAASRASDRGTEIEMDKLIGMLQTECKNRKLTISGGEPLEQASALLELTGSLKKMGFDLCVYTGEERENVPDDLLQNIHYIKTGRYIESMRTFSTPYVGSANQNFITLR